MTAIQLLPHLQMAFGEIFDPEQDGELFTLGTNGISEETLTFRLGYYLQQQFPQHHVDCEYNRYKDELKNDQHVDQPWMMPDIIVHRRGIKRQNLVVIEAKKATSWSGGWHRINQKLRALTRQGNYQYRLGLAWKIACSGDPALHRAIWYFRGEEILRTSLDNYEDELVAALENYGH